MPELHQSVPSAEYPGATGLILPTARRGVELRELASEVDDIAFFEAVEEDREHLSRLGSATSTRYQTLDDVREIRLRMRGKQLRMGIWDATDFTGAINARPDDERTEVEIGYWLRASALGNGYATLAVKAIAPYLEPRFPRVFAEVHEDNDASKKVLERVGFLKSGAITRRWGRAVIFEPAQKA